ncbi:MAG TPA: hypothetical protein VFS64_10065 [Solirubrobacterales bacterium]|nr:hypothetical protein [Solirubrobacterales bacterium]
MKLRASLALLGACALLALPAAAQAAGPEAPAWQLSMVPLPANFTPGATTEYLLTATNVGAAATNGSQVTVETTLPSGLKPLEAYVSTSDHRFTANPSCEAPLGQSVSCKTNEVLHPGHFLLVTVLAEVQAPGAPGEALVAEASVQGGGAAQAASAQASTPISSEPVPFGFLGPLVTPTDQPDGSSAILAGSHPYQLTVDFNFPTERLGNELVGTEHPHNIRVDLPRGLIGDPAATPVRCTEAELESENNPGCPSASQIGLIAPTTTIGGIGTAGVATSPLYNMVPPPGAAAEFGFNVDEIGIFVHLIAGIRTQSDYGASTASNDLVALGTHPVFGVKTQIWGDPSAESHRWIREGCLLSTAECLAKAHQRVPFLTLPGDCPAAPSRFEASADSWEHPGLFKHTGYESADLEGSPISISGCNEESYEPTIEARPTTNQADSPTGLEVDLRQPQQPPVAKGEDPLSGRASAPLKDARVTLPEGVAVNPSQADGLAACSETQIGYLAEDEEPGIHFSDTPESCPDASKLGTMKVSSPLLAEYKNEETEVVADPETGAPIPRPLQGSVYLAQPHQNPFGSLLAVYLAVEDPRSGIVAKLAGRVEADPVTGQLTTVFEENPELPLEDIHLSLFKGARAPLITPIACGTHTTTSDLTPWSAPEGADAHPSDSFEVTGEPGGGACPSSEAAATNSPSFTAGTLSPQAGAYSPFVLKLSREDGSQRLTKIDTTLPKGLAARFVGIPYCSDAQIAQAQARSHPDEGAIEKANPSCPAASKVGTVDVAAGAGPTPFHTQGTAYLAGPYKGAPLSLAIVTPAIAGPFDLGTVTVRTALYVDPETAQGRAVSDPLPTILDGIPLDIRSVAVSLDRPGLTLNPTSCEPMSIVGTATSSLGSAASLTSPFQVGGCSALKFKPKLSLKLSGGTKRGKNPALRAVLTMPPGGANIAKASVALPHSEFLDQAHIRTVCTRVQFAAGAGNGAECPPGSIYGKARAITPLLDQPLEGPVYLRSSSHSLPDLVAALHGQIDVVLDGRIDTVKGGIRTTFDAVPDAPVSKFVLEMQGGKRGLLENSTNLCRSTNRATALFDGQNGKVRDLSPVLRNDCKGKKPGKGKRRHRHPHR